MRGKLKLEEYYWSYPKTIVRVLKRCRNQNIWVVERIKKFEPDYYRMVFSTYCKGCSYTKQKYDCILSRTVIRKLSKLEKLLLI